MTNPFADAFPDDPAPARSTSALPPTYESRQAHERIEQGLRRAGHPEETARFAASIALSEAPFAPPTEDAWRHVCGRARQVAHEGLERPPEERPPVREPVYLDRRRPRP